MDLPQDFCLHFIRTNLFYPLYSNWRASSINVREPLCYAEQRRTSSIKCPRTFTLRCIRLFISSHSYLLSNFANSFYSNFAEQMRWLGDVDRRGKRNVQTYLSIAEEETSPRAHLNAKVRKFSLIHHTLPALSLHTQFPDHHSSRYKFL